MPQSDKEYLKARLTDAVHQCELRSVPKFIGFLNESETALAKAIGTRLNAKFVLFGGHPDAERTFFGVFPDWCEASDELFPIIRLKIKNTSSLAFTHRDVLGAILGLGLERDTVGDIIIGEKESFVFVSQSVAKYITEQLTKVSSAGVVVTEDNQTVLKTAPSFEERSSTVASARLDCVVSALCNLSRSRSCEVITEGLVLLNGYEASKPTVDVHDGDMISVRRQGKFVIDAIGDKTKKGRTVLKYRKYI